MRKLVSIKQIKDIQPIEGADRIDVATIDGWKCVVQKGLYEVGDLVAYCEIDTVLPLDHFPELEKTNGRIKTIRLKGQISQGYCFPIKKLKEILNQELSDICIGIDYTEAIGAKKYEPPITFKNGETEGSFPSHIIPKTDETRIQNDPDFYINKFLGKPYAITVKLDGTSATFGFDEKFFACSRNLMVREGDNVYWNIAHKYNLPEKLDRMRKYVIQGEIVGPGIQKNHLGLNEIDFYVFRVYDRSQKRYLFSAEIDTFCSFTGLKHVPVLEIGDNFNYSMDTLLKRAEGKYDGTKNEREGIVVNLEEEDPTQFGGWLSFKVISNRFLIKGGD